jgi:hypothetical protein
MIVGWVGVPVGLVARTDLVGHIDVDRAARLIGIQQDLQAVPQPIFGDALDTTYQLRSRRSLGRDGEGGGVSQDRKGQN